MEIRLKKESGNVGDVMFTCIGMLAMTALMMAYMGSAGLIFQKAAVSQLARKYILKMETVGELLPEDEVALQQELTELGVTEITLDGTTGKVGYGEPIELHIQGKLKEKYEVEEKRVSSAKN